MAEHFRCYVPRAFKQDALDTIARANDILREYAEARLPALTLRQLYYQFVARGLISNTIASYNRLGALVSDGRLAGLISWTAIEDRGRNLMGVETWETPGRMVKAAAQGYRRDLWREQPWRPEVWVEKDALIGVVAGICNEMRVDFFACRGYNSQSEQWRAGQRFAGYVLRGQRPLVLHLGDHDPSGLDMTRDNRERLELFAGVPVQVVRLALNMNQVEQYRPPPNPAKVTDSRFAAYSAEHGDESWELDALDPAVMRQLIEDAVLRVRDPRLWDTALRREAEERRLLMEAAEDMDLGDV